VRVARKNHRPAVKEGPNKSLKNEFKSSNEFCIRA
jgi:hypothetical protein